MGFPAGSCMKNLPAMRETWIQSSGWEDPLKEGEWPPTPVFLPGESPWTEEPVASPWVAKSQTGLSD